MEIGCDQAPSRRIISLSDSRRQRPRRQSCLPGPTVTHCQISSVQRYLQQQSTLPVNSFNRRHLFDRRSSLVEGHTCPFICCISARQSRMTLSSSITCFCTRASRQPGRCASPRRLPPPSWHSMVTLVDQIDVEHIFMRHVRR